MLEFMMVILVSYLLYGTMYLLLNPNITNFVKNDMPNEIASVKREFKINNKLFDYITIIIFLLSIPILNFKEC
jgi:hypothetical protein